jgi:hypothetical protein
MQAEQSARVTGHVLPLSPNPLIRTGAPEAGDLQPFVALTAADMWQLGVGALGFMMYKVALLGVTLTPKEAREPARQLEKN